MKAKIVKIGNSRGIRLPKLVIEQVGLAEDVELEIRDGEIVISPAEQLRNGWSEAARALSARDDHDLLDESSPTTFDSEEWEW